MVSGLWLSDLLKRYSPLSPRFATFVWREVVVALRWRRLVGFWLITTGILFFLSIQVTPGAPTFAVLGFSVLSPVFFSSFFANSFAIDGAGFQLYWILPMKPERLLRARELVITLFGVTAFGVGWLVLILQRPALSWRTDEIFAITVGCALFVWISGVGRLVSILFPKGVNPHRTSGDGISLPAAAVVFF